MNEGIRSKADILSDNFNNKLNLIVKNMVQKILITIKRLSKF